MTSPHVLFSFPTRLGTAGIGTTAWHQVAGLTRLGARVTLVCGSCERTVPGLHRLIETMKYAGLKIPYRIIGNSLAFQWHDYLAAIALKQLRREIQLVHCWPGGAIKTLRLAKQIHVPSILERPNTHTAFAYQVVANEHQMLGLPLPYRHSHTFDAKSLAREETEYALADKLACSSDFVFKTFHERGFSENHLVRHQYGYDPSQFHQLNTPAPKDRPFTAIFVGQCEPRKGLHYALQAWHESGASANGRFLICGQYTPGYRDLLSRYLNHPSITELGFVTNVAEVMRQCDVLVLPSIEEGSALVTYEARACGLVLLVSDASGARCTHLHDALIHPAKNVQTLRNHFVLLSHDRALLNKLRDASLAGLSTLTWSHAAQRLLDIYHEVIADTCDGASNPSMLNFST